MGTPITEIVRTWEREFDRCDVDYRCDLHYVPDPQRIRGADQETAVDILIARLKEAQG